MKRLYEALTISRQLHTSNVLALVAFGVWLASLPLTVFVLYQKQSHLPGYEVLYSGWLSPLVANVAWFANIFLLRGIYLILSGRLPTKSAIFALLLALDTFRFNEYLLNEAGSTTPIYGYGWGAILWFLSISLFLVSVGARIQENKFAGYIGRYVYLPLGLLLAVITLSVSSYWAIHDRILANSSETQRLARIAFKRGPVCSTPMPVVKQPIKTLSGPVEIITESQTQSDTRLFSEIRTLLDWGIPTLRIGKQDFSFEVKGNEKLLSSIPANGATAATIYVSNPVQYSIKAMMVENTSNRIVFDQTWTLQQAEAGCYCPDYSSYPGPTEQPRKLIMEALSLPTNVATQMGKNTDKDRIDGTIVNISSSEKTVAINTNCPEDVGWDYHNKDPRLKQVVGFPFKLMGRSYYLQDQDEYNAFCAGDSVYNYKGFARDDKYYLHIEKRGLQNFQKEWAKMVVVPGNKTPIRDGDFMIQSINDSPESMYISLFHRGTGQVLSIKGAIKR